MWLGEEHFTLQSSDVISSTDEKRSRLTRDEEVGDESSVGELLIGDEPDPKSAELSEHPLSAGAAELAQLARSDAVVSHRVDPHVVLQAHVRRCEPDTTRLLRQLTTWHCPRVCFGAPTRNAAAADRRATGRAAIDRYLLPPDPQQQTRRTLLQRANVTDRRRDTVPSHRPCSTYYAGTANNMNYEIYCNTI